MPKMTKKQQTKLAGEVAAEVQANGTTDKAVEAFGRLIEDGGALEKLPSRGPRFRNVGLPDGGW